MKLTGKNRSTREKTCPSAILSTKNPMWTDPGSNAGLRDERQATDRLSHDTAMYSLTSVLIPDYSFIPYTKYQSL
jgi:hypothetical protein